MTGGGGGGGMGGYGEMYAAIIQGVTEALDSGLTAAFQAKEAKKGRNFQEAVMKNRIRWAVKDMKRAGINPLTMFMGGGGVPTGAITASQASIGRSGGSQAIRTGAESARARAARERESTQAEINRETVNLVRGQVEAVKASADKDWSDSNLKEAQRHYYKQLEQTERANATIRKNEIPGSINMRQVDEMSTGEFFKWLERAGRAYSGFRR